MVSSESKFNHITDDDVDRVYVRMPEHIRQREQALQSSSVKRSPAVLTNCSETKSLPQPRSVVTETLKTSSVSKSSTEEQLLTSSSSHTSPYSSPHVAEEKFVIDPPCQPVCCEPQPPVCCPQPHPQAEHEYLSIEPIQAAETHYYIKPSESRSSNCNCMNSNVAVREEQRSANLHPPYPPTQIESSCLQPIYAEPISNVYEKPACYSYSNRGVFYVQPNTQQTYCTYP